MSYRSVRESLIGGRNIPAVSQHRRGRSLTSISNSNSKVDSSAAVADENLDLFSKNRRTLSVTSSDESSDGTSHSHKTTSFQSFLRVVELWNENWSSISCVKLRRFSNCALEFELLFIFQFSAGEYSSFLFFFGIFNWCYYYCLIYWDPTIHSFSEVGETFNWISKSVSKWDWWSFVIYRRRKAWLWLVKNFNT